MGHEHLKQKRKLASVLLLGAGIVCVVLILVQVQRFIADSGKAGTLLKDAVAASKPDANDVEKRLADSRTVAEELKKKNLFAPPPPKQHPVNAVSGIMGDEVLINDTWYKLGQMVGDAKIVAIEPTRIKMEWDGQERVFAPIDAPSPAGPSGPRPGGEVAKAEQASGPGAEMVQAGGPPMPGGPGMGMFGNLSEEDRARMREQFMAMRGRFENMSDAERERMREEMRQRFGGRGGGGDRGPGRRGR
jgi:hypothetical protein